MCRGNCVSIHKAYKNHHDMSFKRQLPYDMEGGAWDTY